MILCIININIWKYKISQNCFSKNANDTYLSTEGVYEIVVLLAEFMDGNESDSHGIEFE
jgi:hypothetical protein